MTKNILIVDDEYDFCMMVKEYLDMYGYNVMIATSIEKSLKILDDNIMLVLLDIAMPDLDGINFCKMIRYKFNSPILFISAKDSEETKIKALSAGGDDYITKPFSLKELKARIEAHLRREERANSKKSHVVFSQNIVIDTDAKEVVCMGRRLSLTKKEYKIIELLISNKGMVFDKETIFNNVWDFDSKSYLETVTESIKNIRKKFKKVDPKYSYIETMYGIGYKWQVTPNAK